MSFDDNASRRSSNFGRYGSAPRSSAWDRSGIQGKWQHDLFEENQEPRRQGIDRIKAGIAKHVVAKKRNSDELPRLHIQNLPIDLVEGDIQEMFKKFNLVKEVLHCDPKGTFLGEVDVYFSNSEDASEAHKFYDKADFDGKRISLTLFDKADDKRETVPIAERLSYVGGFPKKATKTIFKKNYGAPQNSFFRRKERRHDKPYNDNFLDRLADDEEFQNEQKEKRHLADLDRELDQYMSKKAEKSGDMETD